MTNIKLPIDISAVEGTASEIAQEQARLEAEQRRFKDLEEITSNVKQLMEAFTQVSNADYIKKATNNTEEKVEEKINPEEILKKAA